MDIEIDDICFDSRKVHTNSLFVAIRGTQTDGHDYIQEAYKKGARCFVVENLESHIVHQLQHSTIIWVNDTSKALGLLASAYYNYPSKKLKIVAITGTNGKTTHVTLLYNLFTEMGYVCGMVSTVHNIIGKEIINSTHTTPDAIQLQMLFAKMVDAGCTYCFMEASSHAIHQNRMSGVHLTGALFSNITHDHLDYHGTFENYILAKKKLFDDLPASAFALANIDDKRGEIMLQNTKATKHFFSLQYPVEFSARLLSNSLSGLELEIENQHIWFTLIGKFNAYNVLGVYATAVLLGHDKTEILKTLSKTRGAKGRFEQVISKTGVISIVDYAHTPDALENVLSTIQELRTRNEKVITVVGCGGNRDTAKRPLMAAIAAKYSDICILTSDNPRYENPKDIINQMLIGVKSIDYKKTKVIEDRKEAIQFSISIAVKGDIILVAGKGHENYQEIAGIKHHFDDREVIELTYKECNK